MRNRLIIAAKVAVSIGVLYSVGKHFEANQLMTSLDHVEPLYLLAAIVFALLAVPVVSYRWRLLAGMLAVQISFAVATRATFAGLFVGQVLPGAIGADVVRGWMVWNMGLSNKLIIASIVMDRLVSLLALVLIIGATLPILLPYLPNNIIVCVEWSLFGLIIIMLLCYLCFRSLHLSNPNQIIGRFLNKLDIEGIHISGRVVIASLSLSVVGHGFTILSAFFLSLAIGIDTSLWMWLLVMPIIMLVNVIPVSINGWGIREIVMIYLWGLFGIEDAGAFLISVCLGIIAIISSLPGFWFWLEKKQHSR